MRVRRLLGLGAVWLALAVPMWGALFVHSSSEMTVAGHDAVVRPTFDRHVRLLTGPYIPDLRMPSGSRIGVRITVGKTTAQNTDELIQRYALIANNPDVAVRAVTRQVKQMAIDAGLRAGVFALLPVLGWELLGARRRAELLKPDPRRGALVAVFLAAAAFVAYQPWRPLLPEEGASSWIDLPDAVPELSVPAELDKVQIQGGFLTQNTRKLIGSAFHAFDSSKTFYADLADQAPALADQLHQPEEGQTVAILISDRHDNIGMDPVARAFADQAGATMVIDAGDDTSMGEPWEGFSLESLDSAFSDLPHRLAVSGNHDHGSFVSGYLADRGWTHLDHHSTEVDGVRFYGVDDPRSSGLGDYRDQRGPSFSEVEDQTADEVCELDEKGERVNVLVVHDANMARTALSRGCVDLVVAGHLHVQIGPDRVVADDGRVGYTYTNGTTGGAAYAVAVGSKLRREAEFSFVTFADGLPVGIQPVRLTTHGDIRVGDYLPLDLGQDEKAEPDQTE